MRKTSIIEEKERLTTCPTSLSGVSLRTKPGVYPSISSKMVDLLYWRARDYAQYYFAIKDLREKLLEIIDKIDSRSIKLDLESLVKDKTFADNLSNNLKKILKKRL